MGHIGRKYSTPARELIESRFSNPEVRDTVPILCQDASNRLPKFILPIVQANLDQGKYCKGLALVIALWCRLCAKVADPESAITIQDAQANRLINQAILAKYNPFIFLQMHNIFGTLGDQDNFVQHFSNWLNSLRDVGTCSTLKHYLS
ncbi:hypothetical protein AB6T38_17480 [Aliiglaciecola sp. SL4]|uniref:mannitol dehydrogenase family protein n=1 Tax=Aliiglaciecola sp. SL4 TaxID=3239806 RepID=UPI00355BE03D